MPVMSEPADSHDGEREKQDCEMNASKLIACWGRRRWNIENGFNAQKNDGFGADVPVCRMSREHLIL